MPGDGSIGLSPFFDFFLAGIFLLTSCQEEDWLPGDHLHPESSKIDAARLYFEDAISRAASSGITMKNNTWSPGEITPEWKNAIYKKSGQYEFLFIPVLAQNHYLAEERIARKSGMEYYRVRVSQFLAIRRNIGGDYSMVCFSLIPSKEYYRDNKNKVVEKFLESSSYYGDFTGRVVYHSVAGGTLMGVEKVGNGVFEWGFWKEEDTGPEEIRANFQKMFENISVFQVISTRGPIYDGGMLEEAECIYCQKCHKQVEPGHVCSSQEEQKEDSPEGNVSGGDKGAGESWVGGSTGGTGSTGSTGGGGGGGIIGGGGNPFVGKPTEYVKQKGDKFIKENVPDSVNKQVGSTCVFASMNYVSQVLGKEINDGVFIKTYMDLYHKEIWEVIDKGVNTSRHCP